MISRRAAAFTVIPPRGHEARGIQTHLSLKRSYGSGMLTHRIHSDRLRFVEMNRVSSREFPGLEAHSKLPMRFAVRGILGGAGCAGSWIVTDSLLVDAVPILRELVSARFFATSVVPPRCAKSRAIMRSESHPPKFKPPPAPRACPNHLETGFQPRFGAGAVSPGAAARAGASALAVVGDARAQCLPARGKGAAWPAKPRRGGEGGHERRHRHAFAAEPVPARELARWVRRRRAREPSGPAEHKKA
jgi:hypothetical protein